MLWIVRRTVSPIHEIAQRPTRIAAALVCALFIGGFAIPSQAQEPDREWIPFEEAEAPAVQATHALTKAKSTSGTTVGVTSFSGTGKNPWDEYDKKVQASGVIGTLGPDLFGDKVEFYKNTLSFSVNDISLDGNFALPVSVTRKLQVIDRYAFDGGFGGHDLPLLDWDLDIPNISGVYAPTWTNSRCSSYDLPEAPAGSGGFQTHDFWNGLIADMRGGGELLVPNSPPKMVAPRPTNGDTHRWMTAGLTYFRCTTDAPATQSTPAVDAVGNADGEGFEAITTDGTKYTFGWMALNIQPESRRPTQTNSQGDQTGYAPLVRKLNSLYVTKITDRLGNTVTFTYDNTASASVRLRRIEASDGRLITLDYTGGTPVNATEYSGGTLTSASAHGRTWTYQYTNGSLSAVVLPDASRWTYDFRGLSYAIIEPDLDPLLQRNCNSHSAFVTGGGTGTVTHPSGAIGKFTVAPMRHGRSNVPKYCDNWSYTNNNPNDDISVIPRSFTVLSIKLKEISGPGVIPFEWEYVGGSLSSWFPAASNQGYQPVCQTENCMEPVCVTDGCAGKHITSVIGREVISPTNKPVREFQRITFGNSYKYNEGKMLSIERGLNSDPATKLETETYGYELAHTGQEFATPIGQSLQPRAAGWASEYVRPQISKIINRDGVNFTSATVLFDEFVRPLVIERYNDLPVTPRYFRRDTTTYREDDLEKWVVGLVEKTTTNNEAGTAEVIVSETSYYEDSYLPKTVTSFGLPEYTLSYYGDGTLKDVTDGRLFVTRFGNWKLGVPQSITLADDSTLSSVVNDAGLITQVTDETGTVTGFGYDAMGRLTLTDYTNADTVAWNSTNRTFAPITESVHGVPAGSWKHTIWTGNGRTTTWYNGRWQPVLALIEDTANPATQSFVVTRYDANGRKSFESYPVSGAAFTGISQQLDGVTLQYDAIGRVTQVIQDSEIDDLATITTYSAPFKMTVKDPRQFSTTTEFQAYDTPTTEAPVKIVAPETQTTLIKRDTFFKPTLITRSGTFDGAQISVTRSHVYDAHQRLCLTFEPETGLATATHGMAVQDYDAAGNLIWSVDGRTPVNSNCQFERSRVQAELDADPNLAETRTFRTYDELNRVEQVNVPNTPGVVAGDLTYEYYADGTLKSLVNGTVANGARWDYTYNGRGLPSTEKLTFGGKVRTLTHTYNVNAHELSLTYPSGLVINHAPNALGRAQQASTFATGVTYFPNGGMAGFNYGACSGSPAACVKHTLWQNIRKLPERSLDQRGTDAPILDNTYTYDANGNVASITDGGSNPGRTRDELTYDGLNRLTHTRAPALSWIYADTVYDPLDNIRSNTVGSRTWTYLYDADKNRLTTLLKPAATAIAYDVRGNITAHGAVGYVFDAASRMVQASGKESYAYDGHGRRVWSLRLDNNKASFPMYSLDGKLITEDDNRSNLTTDYVYLNGSLVAKQYKTIGGSTWTKRFLYTDALGSPTGESDAGGTGVIKYEHYTPYGEQTDTLNGAVIEQGPAFTGHVTDAATGLSYMQQRYYDPALGRFLSVDPIGAGLGDDFNRYSYAANNPLRFVDPDGRRRMETNSASVKSYVLSPQDKKDEEGETDPSDDKTDGGPDGAPTHDPKTNPANIPTPGVFSYYDPDDNRRHVVEVPIESVCPECYLIPFLRLGKATTGTAGAAEGASLVGGEHIVLGLESYGLRSIAAQVGGRTLMSDTNWKTTLIQAIANPSARITVSLEGFAGRGTHQQVMQAVHKGSIPGAGQTNWEMFQLYQAGRLGSVEFVNAAGKVANPF